MQKKLLYHSLVDGYNLKVLNLPTTNYILSKVFDLYSKVSNSKKKNSYTFKDDKDSSRTYKLYLRKDNSITKIVIEEFYNDSKINQHIYW